MIEMRRRRRRRLPIPPEVRKEVDMGDKFTTKGCNEDSALSGRNAILKISQVLEKLQDAFSDKNLGSLVHKKIKIGGIYDPYDQNDPLREERENNQNCEDWFGDGIDCEILTPGKNEWQKGKVRLKVKVEVEFIPDEPETSEAESPLDDFRQKLRDET